MATGDKYPVVMQSQLGQAGGPAQVGSEGVLTPNTAVVTDENGDLQSSNVTATELGYLNGTTSNVQEQLGDKAEISHEQDFCGTGENIYIAYPKDGRVRTLSATPLTGYIKIIVPHINNNASGLLVFFTVDVYLYEANSGFQLKAGGYLINTNLSWDRVTAYIESNCSTPYNTLPVYFGNDGTNVAVYIGNSDTTWDYPQITIKDISIRQTGGNIDNFNSGWSVSFVDTLGDISQTVSNTSLYVGGFSPNLVIVSNSSGSLSSSSVTSTELTYLSGATSNIQDQINALQTQLTELQSRISTLESSGG